MDQRVHFLLRTSESTKTPTICDFVWQSVDIGSILGDLYDKYDYFNLSLHQIGTGIRNTGTYGSHGAQSALMMSGLNWENCNYNVITGKNQIKSCVGFYRFRNTSNTIGDVYTLPEGIKNTFRKSSRCVDLSISLNLLLDTTSASTWNTDMSEMVFSFVITPCESYDDTCGLLFFPGINAIISNSGATKKYNNVNMKNLMGQLFEKYKTFSLELIQLNSTTISAVVNANSNSVNVQLCGLPFKTDYDTTNFLSDSAIIGDAGFLFALLEYQGNMTNAVIIKNPPPVSDITINFISAQTSSLVSITTGNLASISLLIKITPIV